MTRFTSLAAALLASAVALPVAGQTPLSPNRTINGELTISDTPMPYGNGRMDCYVFNVPAGRYRINLESDVFHPFVISGPGQSCAGDLERGSFGSDGRSAEIRVNVVRGPWFIRVAAKEYGFGPYRLRLTLADQPRTPMSSASASQTPPSLELTRNMACGYRPGSRELRALNVYREPNSPDYRYVQHESRPVTWTSLGFAEARQRPWYINGDPITFQGQRYEKYGLPRILSPSEVRFGDEYDGQGIMVDPMATEHYVVYLIVNGMACEFQPYQRMVTR